MWSANDLRYFEKVNEDGNYRCPICFEELDLEKDDEEEIYSEFDGEIYHYDCIVELMSDIGDEFIKSRIQDFVEWYLDCRFNNKFYYEPWLVEGMLADRENVQTWLEDNIDDFMRWAKDNENI